MSGARRGRVYGVAGENLGSFTGDAGCGGRVHGMRGEQRTAVLLDGLAGRGFTVLHSVRVRGGAADIDHVLIGSRGVVLIPNRLVPSQLLHFLLRQLSVKNQCRSIKNSENYLVQF